MEANACCSQCGGEAKRICLCQKPAKTYLCENCLHSHINKPGLAHPLFDIDVIDIDDIDLYNSRGESFKSLLSKFQEMKTRLEAEKQKMQATINEIWEQESTKINNLYTETSQRVTQVYEGVFQIIEYMKTDIELLKRKRTVNLSNWTEAFLQLVSHPEKQLQPILDVRTEAQKTWESRNGLTVTDVFQLWMCGVPDCPNCKANKEGLHLDGQMGSKYWRCSCGFQYNINQNCEQCRSSRSSQVLGRREDPVVPMAYPSYVQEGYDYQQLPIEQVVPVQPAVRELGDGSPFVYLCSTCAHPQIPKDERFICLACGSAN